MLNERMQIVSKHQRTPKMNPKKKQQHDKNIKVLFERGKVDWK